MNRRAFLASLAAGGTLAGTGSVLLAPVLAAPAPDPIGDLLAELPADPMARVHAAIAELKEAITAVEPSLSEWFVSGADDLGQRAGAGAGKPSFGLLAWSPPPVVTFSGGGVYEVKIQRNGRVVTPIWWVEESPRKPGFYRMRHHWRGKPSRDWLRLPAGEVRFLRRVDDPVTIARHAPAGIIPKTTSELACAF